jgi:hypothetical protein
LQRKEKYAFYAKINATELRINFNRHVYKNKKENEKKEEKKQRIPITVLTNVPCFAIVLFHKNKRPACLEGGSAAFPLLQLKKSRYG